MATLVTKNSSTAAAVPGTGDLVQGELAVNVTDKRLFTKNAGGTVVEVGTNPSTIENNLLIGTTTNASGRRLLVNGTGSGATYAAVGDISQTANQVVLGIEPAASLSWLNSTSWSLAFGTAGTEKMRLDTNGHLMIGTSTALSLRRGIQVLSPTGTYVAGSFTNDAGASAQTIETWNKATTGNNSFVSFATEGTFTERGQINYNRAGGLVAYNTTSDYRAKDIIGPVQNPGATIDALKVYEGVMKGATQSRPMLVAHEAQAVAPYCVTGEKDAVSEDGAPIFQQMDVSALVPLLLVEIQSLRSRVAALEAA